MLSVVLKSECGTAKLSDVVPVARLEGFRALNPSKLEGFRALNPSHMEAFDWLIDLFIRILKFYNFYTGLINH